MNAAPEGLSAAGLTAFFGFAFTGAGFAAAASPGIRFQWRSTGVGSETNTKWCASPPEWYGRVTW